MKTATAPINRSDFLAIYTAEGADGLNRVLRERLPDDAQRFAELERMAKGAWLVNWDDDAGTAEIVGRKD